jgi:putative LysE/RhtB family amino acid efflux pump
VHAFTVGFGLGFFVALQLGPLSLYLIRSTLRNGWEVGLAIGPLDTILGLLGAAVLLLLGARTLRSAFRIRLGDGAEPVSPRRGFLTALSATASNPLTIASWAAIFSAASAAGAADSIPGAVLLILGVGIGSLTWDVTLATGTALVGRSAGERLLRVVDLVAGIGLIVFGVLLAHSVLSD